MCVFVSVCVCVVCLYFSKCERETGKENKEKGRESGGVEIYSSSSSRREKAGVREKERKTGI